jgi:large subunit ribosomal protein L6
LSRIGKVPIPIPKGVDVKVDGRMVIVKGPKGQLQQEVSPDIKVEVADGKVQCSAVAHLKDTKAKWGLYRVLIHNMITGVVSGYSKDLEIVGVGYKAEVKGKSLTLNVGHSHPVSVLAKGGVTFTVPAPNKINVSGIDKQAVGQVAAEIRAVRPPEPYQGKGIRFANEVIRKKAGKTAAAGK